MEMERTDNSHEIDYHMFSVNYSWATVGAMTPKNNARFQILTRRIVVQLGTCRECIKISGGNIDRL